MGNTIVEKVMARAAGLSEIHPGQYVDCKLDRIIAHEEFYRIHAVAVAGGLKDGLPDIWDRERFHVVLDHFQPVINETQALRQRKIREVAQAYQVKYFDDALPGVVHRIALEDYVLPGELGLGSDSHSCAWGALNCCGSGMGEHELAYGLVFGELWFKVPETIAVNLYGDLRPGVTSKDVALWLAGEYGTSFALYKALEFRGPGVANLNMDARITLSSHAVELGGKFGLFEFDEKTAAFLSQRKRMRHQLAWANPVSADPDAVYCQTVNVDLSTLEPQVAKPHTFENVVPVSEIAGRRIDQAMVGSCANGNLEDIQIVANVVHGKRVHPNTRFIVQPNSWGVYRAAMKHGYVDTLLDAGVTVISPGCHLCLGMQGALAEGDVCLTSTTRNHKGRMGSPKADIYLAGPATVAVSALAGEIRNPLEV
ncbi:aconitase/3-isopropylmalate dehydratase large subunit family protein [Bordetella sp. BOR01]|uniref:3-isopropylmalate dehydratase large subunit n=1 Tax=Bordetella sp. BOR01 TaxID=2854779 RepID=UPI001C46F39E|nr:aconitase/3-isopropylmalate dehydratase large subunit family protein [Bordetella sp. BOR01]MBV7484625.1 3-isopropylmalate dehydratase large subunit [Bordetella sp. BOR01]